MWFEFFVLGTIWFWLLLIGTFATITWCIESTAYGDSDKGGGFGATVTLIVFFLIYFFLGSNQDVIDAISWIKQNPVTLLFYLLGYYAVGVGWSMVKWYLLLKYKASEVLKRLEDTMNPDSFYYTAPKAIDNKNRIISWMSYWPFSMPWTAFNKLILRVWDYLYVQFEGTFNRIQKHVFGDVEDAINAKKLAVQKAREAKEQK